MIYTCLQITKIYEHNHLKLQKLTNEKITFSAKDVPPGGSHISDNITLSDNPELTRGLALLNN